MNVKTITMYLPQFHQIPENDTWWGKGFTEWTTVQKAKPLYPGHRQPRVPMNHYYYNLLDKQVMEQQVAWMKEYGIDGQCIYHYYFKDGRKILEQPAENLLKWKDVDMHFCFSWANQRWARTWSNLNGNSWADLYEKKDPNEPAVLLEQAYGRELEWEAHFNYLLPFFEDERYIKVNNRPVFVVHSPDQISCLFAMIEYFDKKACDHGFPGIYFVGVGHEYPIAGMQAMIQLAPFAYWDIIDVQRENGIRRPSYDLICKNAKDAEPFEQCKTYFSAIVDCDDTPRRGKNGISIEGSTIDKFRDHLSELYLKSEKLDNEFLFINAWNEWGEGMYLEPDEENGFAYLCAVKDAKKNAEKECCEGRKSTKLCTTKRTLSDNSVILRRTKLNADCFDKWLYLKESGRSITDILKMFHVDSVAIYGLGKVGKHLLTELEQEERIDITCIIDRNTEKHHPRYPVIGPDEHIPEVEAVIVTSLWDYERIYQKIRERCGYRIFSVMELLDEAISQ